MASKEERRKREGSFPRGLDSVDKGEKRKTKKRGKKEKRNEGRKEKKRKKNGGELCVRSEGKRDFPGIPMVPLSSEGYVQAANPHRGP